MAEKKDTAQAAAAAAAPAEDSGLRTFEVLEEDDGFEEFAEDNWTEAQEAGDDKKDWEDNWDDEDPSDDFVRQLREELSRNDAQHEQQMQA